MKRSRSARAEFQRAGRKGGKTRAARMTPEARSEVSRRAAMARWLQERFGAASFEALGLPGGEIVDRALAALAGGRETAESLLVSLAAPRLRREGVPIGEVLEDPEERLYRLLARANPGLAYARYRAYLRQAASFADACRAARVGAGRGAVK